MKKYIIGLMLGAIVTVSVLFAQSKDRIDQVFSTRSGSGEARGHECQFAVYKLTMSDRIRYVGTCFCERGGDATSTCGITVSE